MKSIAVSLLFVAASVRAASASTQSVYGQCGGIGWAGPTTCASGSACTYNNDYYSQCLPGTASATSSACSASSSSAAPVSTSAAAEDVASTQSVYGQCGGTGYTGATVCASGSVCTFENEYYSQCMPGTASATAISTVKPATSAKMTTVRSSAISATSTASLSTVTFSAETTITKSGSTAAASTPSSVKPSTTAESTKSTLVSTVATSSSVKSTAKSTVAASSTIETSTSSTVKTTSTSSSATASATASASSGALGPLGGVNTAGYDFSVYTDGSFSGTGIPPPASQYAHFASQGANIFRIPFAWQLMTPTLGGSIDETWFATFDATVQSALTASTSPYVILDLHNYARWNGGIVGQGGPTNDQFANLWSQIATKYASNDKIIFGIMNEPHDLPSLSEWATSVQAAITAIRAAGATTQYILMPGSSYSSAGTLPTEAGPYLAALTDTSGGTEKLLFDVHKYLDSDGSGTSTECVTDNVTVLTTLVTWLKSVGNRQAILSETGGGNTASCETYLDSELAYVKANSASIAGFTVWAAGSFDSTYALTVTPNTDGTDQPLWTDAVVPNLP